MQMAVSQQNIQFQLQQIAKDLEEPFDYPYPGLYTGDMGEALFLMHYARYTGEEHWNEVAHARLERVFELIDDKPYIPALCRGLAGIFWGIEYLIAQGFIEDDIRESLEEFDEYLSASMLQHIRAGHFDFLHGALGMALYLLKHRRSNPAVEAALREVIDHLEAQAIRPDDNKMYWLASVSDTEHGLLNIALSHGITAVAMLLCRYIAEDVEPLRCREMLEKVVAQILEERIDEQVHGSCFPSANKARDQRHLFSRLGWCYGDLGIALMLWQCGNAIDRADWKAEALRIFQFNCKRRDAGANFINDAGFCHGAAGVALIFQRMYRETGLPEFLETAQYWHAYTLQMAAPGLGVGGYKVYATKPIPIDDMNRNLLEGAAGIGMCLLHADLELSQDWDAVFLLSM